jgi:hypothetical protein
MKIPRVVTIGGRRIKVKFVEMKDLGIADYERGEILIKKGMKRSAQEAVFFHEIYHHMNSTLNHSVLDSLAEQTYQVLKHAKII